MLQEFFYFPRLFFPNTSLKLSSLLDYDYGLLSQLPRLKKKYEGNTFV